MPDTPEIGSSQLEAGPMAPLESTHAAKRRRFRSLIGGIAICLVILLAVAATKSWRDLALARERQIELEAEIVATTDRIEVLSTRIDDLRNDPAAIERLAREDLGFARKGEAIIRTEPVLSLQSQAETAAPRAVAEGPAGDG